MCDIPIHQDPALSPSKAPSHRFATMDALCDALGATRVPRKVLVANNGLAAAKGIRSMRQWCFQHLGNADALRFEVMATPEDLGVDAEFIRMADHYVEVPGGSNANNYANVDLITSIAIQQKCDSVYPGWGHASENPALPRELLQRSRGRVAFLGPAEAAMFALGDKIASTILAQSFGVPTVGWSGASLRLPATAAAGPREATGGNAQYALVPHELHDRAFVRTAQECLAACDAVGYPVMIKASEGGGGKGIRKVLRREEAHDAFLQVQAEVAGCHIFVMRMLSNVRHLEVQLLADAYGACIAVRTRDCSVQRRHQKIIEEGPVVGVAPETIIAMEQAAVRMAKAVGYIGLGTVEYMYDRETGEFSFLELNPRIQVEHPVSELISGVNLPAALLCVGMGMPLHRIPEVRAFYGEEPYADSPIDFDARNPVPPKEHAIAVRITAEDADEGFRPTTGSIDEISFKNSRQCWGYFSVGTAGGGIHQFADSQFGHIFATGENREEARRAMILALQSLSVRGEIRTSTAYVLELLDRAEFKDSAVSTAWLDGLIAARAVRPSAGDAFSALAAAAVFRFSRMLAKNADEYASFLRAGHTPSADLLVSGRSDTFVMAGKKYTVHTGLLAPSTYAVVLNDNVIEVPCRELTGSGSGALQLTLGGRNVVAYVEEGPMGVRVTIQGRAVVFTNDADPTKLRAAVSGKLVRYLVPDGGRVEQGAPFCEIEVMKMLLPLNSTVTGVVHLRATPGATLAAGKLLAEVDPDDPSKLERAEEDTTTVWPASFTVQTATAEPHSPQGVEASPLGAVERARKAVSTLFNLVHGFHPSGAAAHAVPLRARLDECFDDLASLCLTGVNFRALNLRVLDDSAEAATLDAITAPCDKLQYVFDLLIRSYLAVETLFDGRTRTATIDGLRAQFPEEPRRVFDVDFRHAQPHVLETVRSILVYLNSDRNLMKLCQPLLENIAAMRNSSVYGPVLLQARFLLRQCSTASFEERIVQLREKLDRGRMNDIVYSSVSLDLMCALLFDRHSPTTAPVALELIIRRSYFGQGDITNIDVFRSGTEWRASWRLSARQAQTLHLLVNSGASPATATLSPAGPGVLVNGIAPAAVGHCLVAPDDTEFEAALPKFAQWAVQHGSGESGVIIAFVQVSNDAQPSAMAEKYGRMLRSSGVLSALTGSPVKRVTVMAYGAAKGPHIFTFTADRDFGEDTVLRNLHPATASRLELHRLNLNYNFEMFPTAFRKMHFYIATPKSPSHKERRLFVRCYFCPGDLNLEPWATLTDVECMQVVQMMIASVDLAQSDRSFGKTTFNHVFVNLVDLTFDLVNVTPMLRSLAASVADSFRRLGVHEIEISFRVPMPTECGSCTEAYVPFRAFITNRTGFELSIELFIEVVQQDGRVVLLRADNSCDLPTLMNQVHDPSMVQQLHKWGAQTAGSFRDLTALPDADCETPLARAVASPAARSQVLHRVLSMLPVVKGSQAHQRQLSESTVKTPTFDDAKPLDASVSASPSSLPARECEAYPLLTGAQLRRLQAHSAGTTFVHDWTTVFEIAARRAWRAFGKARGIAYDALRLPAELVKVSHLILDPATKVVTEVPHDPEGPLLQGTAGMVAWQLRVTVPSLFDAAAGTPAGERSVVVVANDITVGSGSFSTVEDAVFSAVSVYARAHGLPFVYLSANSGARLGVATEVQKRFKAALKATASGEPTLDYLYLTEEDYTAMQQLKVDVRVSEVMAGSEKRYRIHDIVGSAKEPIGVENLQGSALLAGQMSLNYATVPTISVVTGRSVGIGAYLNRLGRRVVQVSGAPIILTGAAALNRLLGKDVYSSNDQIGGNGIMQPNGVSHWGTKDDLAAVQCVMRWLDYVVPDTTVAAPLVPRAITQCVPDPIDRDVTFAPTVATPYDPRQMLDGALAENGLEGIFDRGSFQEALAEWAPSVVVGRATLGGLPCGVIAVETRTVRKHDPADPADPSSRATFTAQAGQVWFPDSARKTADAMEDFRLERLPCFVVANWRGFSGGMRDMFDEVLKFGASIVDNLRVYDQPVMIYVPKYGELRGGAWVVVDPIINHNGCVRMYADPTARGGILEPAGVVEIKFREPEVRALWRRSRVAELNAAQTAQQLPPLDDAALKRRENQELPIFNDVAVTFADLHDTPTRMLAKGCITGIVPLADARRFFYWALRRATCEMAIARRLRAAGVDGATESLTAALAAVARCVPPPTAAAAVDGADYKALMQANMDDAAYWCSPAAAAVVDAACNSARGARLAAMLKELGAAGPDMAAAFAQAIGALGADVATAVKSML